MCVHERVSTPLEAEEPCSAVIRGKPLNELIQAKLWCCSPLRGSWEIKGRRWDGGVTFKLCNRWTNLTLQGYSRTSQMRYAAQIPFRRIVLYLQSKVDFSHARTCTCKQEAHTFGQSKIYLFFSYFSGMAHGIAVLVSQSTTLVQTETSKQLLGRWPWYLIETLTPPSDSIVIILWPLISSISAILGQDFDFKWSNTGWQPNN